MSLNSWVQSGEVCIWQPKQKNRNFKGWHFSADHQGYSSLIELLDLLACAEIGCRRTITLKKPSSDLPPPNKAKLYTAKATIRLVDTGELWNIKFTDQRLYADLSLRGIQVLREGMLEAQKGGYDFSIGSAEGDPIWFW